QARLDAGVAWLSGAGPPLVGRRRRRTAGRGGRRASLSRERRHAGAPDDCGPAREPARRRQWAALSRAPPSVSLAPPDASRPRRAKRVAARREQSTTARAYGTRAVPVTWLDGPGERFRCGATATRLSARRRQPRARRIDSGADPALARRDGNWADWL